MTSESFGLRLSVEMVRLVDRLCDRFERDWQEERGQEERGQLEQYLVEVPAEYRDYLLQELVSIERHYRRSPSGDPVTLSGLVEVHPALAAKLEAVWDREANPILSSRTGMITLRPGGVGSSPSVGSSSSDGSLSDGLPSGEPLSDVLLGDARPSHGLHIRCPHCCHQVELLADTPYEDVTCNTCGSSFCLVNREESGDVVPDRQTIGRFELISRLGMGGFGTVWKARDCDLQRTVALKIPRKGNLLSHDVDFFFREARAAAQLCHPHIAAVHEIGRDGETIFIVSDFIRGITLTDWMVKHRANTREVAQLGSRIAEALEHAHQHGVIHRDLKPSNIMIDQRGGPLLLDFGLAKRETGELTLTYDGQVLGTAAYMSPEQADGKGHWTDARSDLYSLGVILFELLTGELPYRGNFERQLYEKQHDDAPNPRKLNRFIPQDLATISLKCLERDPNGRYRSAKIVAAELRRFLRGEPIHARPLSRLQKGWRWAKRKPALASALLLTLMVAVAGPIVVLIIRSQSLELAGNLQEQIMLVGRQQQGRQTLELEKQQLQQQLDTIRGLDPVVQTLRQGWRQNLIATILEQHDTAAAESLNTDKLSIHDGVRMHLGLAALLAEINKTSKAIIHMEAAEGLLSKLVERHPGNIPYRAALADCCDRLGQLTRTTDQESAYKMAERALALRRQLVAAQPDIARNHVDLLVSHMSTSPPHEELQQMVERLKLQPDLAQSVLDRWPVEPTEFYQAACHLTLRNPTLYLPELNDKSQSIEETAGANTATDASD